MVGLVNRTLLVYFVVVTSAFSATHWMCLKSPHFDVYTDAGEPLARDVLRRLELAHSVIDSGPGHCLCT